MDGLDTAALVPLRATRRVHVDVDAAVKSLSNRELPWLGPSADTDERDGQRAFHCDLRVPVRAAGHEIDFRKAALVELGPAKRMDGHMSVDIAWRSANLAPLFPTFAGHLTVEPEMLILEGWYAPPGGRLGLALDRALLGIAARRTAVWFLDLVARAVSGDGRR